jgi:hypothetical protein
MKFNIHVQKTRNNISTIKIVDVFATLQLTLPKQYDCVFSKLSKSMIKSESTEIMKKMSAGVHSDRTLLMIPSIL